MNETFQTRLSWRNQAAWFAVAALGLVIASYAYYRLEVNSLRQERYEDIKSIADLKAGQIQRWRRERLADAGRTVKSPLLSKAVSDWLRDPENPAFRNALQSRLDLEHDVGVYGDAVLFAPDGRVLLSASKQADVPGEEVQQTIQAAISRRDAVLSDFSRCSDGRICLDATAPVFDADGHPLAVLALRSFADDLLYPLIQSWPTPSRSAETLLVRADGEHVLFLNELRHRKNTALAFRIPLSRKDVPAVQVILGKQGMFEGRDYRGERVLADLRAIPGTPWFMVAKVDRSEIMAEAGYRAGITALFVFLLILLAAEAAFYSYRNRQADLYRRLYETERRQREAEEEFRTTLYSIGDAVITTDTVGRVRNMNPVAERLTGWPESDARGKPLDEVFCIVNEDTRATVENPVVRVLREGAVVGLANHTLLLSKDGREYPIADSGAPIRNESGAVLGVVLVFRDQTGERAAQDAFRVSENRYRSLFDNLIEGFAHCRMIYDENGRPVDYVHLNVNKAFEEMTGLTDVIGKPISEVIPGIRESNPELFEIYGRVAGSGVPERFETMVPALERHFSVSAYSVERGTFYVTFDDITARKRAEEEQARLETQLRQAQKMEAVGQLAGGIAHDFNNLLQVILGHLDILRAGSEPGSATRQDLDEVHRAAERAAELTRQLLAFSRRHVIQPVNVDLNELIQPMLKMIRRIIGEHIDLRFLRGERLGTVCVDKGQFEQVLMNLCVNARDAMPGGGMLTIETENVTIGQDYRKSHPWAVEGRYVLLSVNDTGHGMDDETLGKIFEPFFTTKAVGHGTGLGLATVYGIVKHHNGLIHVYSEPGKGTTFKIYIPIVDRPAEAVGSKIEPRAVGGSETILMAEDEEMVRGLVARLLRNAGYTVLTACDGEEALRIFEEHDGQIHLALLDVMMPKLGGREVMERIKKKSPSVRFLFSSGYSENAVHTNFVVKEGFNLISKPYRTPELLRAIRKVLDA